MKKFKLTTPQMTTRGGFSWEVGKVYRTSGKGDLCGPGWLHGYHHPLLAVLLNPIHANIIDPRLWIAECGGEFKDDHGLKFGCTQMAILEEMPIPTVTVEQHIAFGILCAKEVCKDSGWNLWADKWLSGEDRSSDAASSAASSVASAASSVASSAASMASATFDYVASLASAASVASAAREKPLDLIAIAKKAVKLL